MDQLNRDRKIIQKILQEYADIPYSHGDIKCTPIFDLENDHYLLVNVGWDKKRVHGCLVHVDIIDGKFWIQRDGTEDGIAAELEGNGISRERIVLAFRSPEIRQYTEYAVA